MAHIPVLLNEAIEGLNIHPGDTILDGTFGGGGHSSLICEKIGKAGTLVAIDADSEAKERANKKGWNCKFELVTDNFRNLDVILNARGIKKVDGVLFDLGLSSFQLDDSGRGFTFQKDEPLKMTFHTKEGGLTAEEIVNEWDENNLADIIYGYGGEQFSKRIAKGIVGAREEKHVKTTFELVRIIESAVPNFYKLRKIHCATKTFQAIRIAVNDEMVALREVLPKAWMVIAPHGRLAVISFHELEDRTVKNFLREKAKLKECNLITKKPIMPGDKEIADNLRSRSAKLRIGEKNVSK
ncbi:MAG: 16S rRNA (cytosine(1402)-N(4))-methyltransferase RsmH [Candidatus Vogelbacteria bacterium]|nr:16S rRNA (cytosine(1402)-N(4))-methyltransferase RsmH [Candidatus Vogelbacteria bacterium]